LTKLFSNGILIGENTLRAVRSRLEVAEVDISGDAAQEINNMKVYELLERRLEKETVALAG
jgi:hypothetical protein